MWLGGLVDEVSHLLREADMASTVQQVEARMGRGEFEEGLGAAAAACKDIIGKV